MAKSKWGAASTVLMGAFALVTIAKTFVDQKHQDELIEEAVEKRLGEQTEEE